MLAIGHFCPGVIWNIPENLAIGRIEKTKKNVNPNL